jgi:RNase P subunit RPR2
MATIPAVSAEQVDVIPRCVECDALWLPGDPERWRCYLDVAWELVFYCPECAEREFDKGSGDSV